jgi:hypothetical protein
MPAPRYVLIANPGTKRCEAYRRALAAAADVTVVPWADVAARDGDLGGRAAFDRPAVVRMESPGKDDRAYRAMLAAGARDDPAGPARDWSNLEISKGELVRPGLWYRGFRRVLTGLRRSFDARPHLMPTACPLAVAEMFDKTATGRKLAAAGVPVPEWLDDPGELTRPLTADDLAHYLHRDPCPPPRLPRGWPVLYLKLNAGSSASGIVALRVAGRRVVGATTLAPAGGRFFNSRRVRDLSGEALARAADFLLAEGAIAQQGIPMAQLDGQNFDLRVVCLYGEPVATVVRVSPHPMTNLHLGGRRGDLERCRAAVPPRAWLDARDHCVAAAGCFRSAVAGVDVVFERGTWRPFVLEVNAFGDFFPGWADARGRSLHALEIEATAGRVL